MISIWNVIEVNSIIVMAYLLLLMGGRRLPIIQQRILILLIPFIAVVISGIKIMALDPTITVNVPTIVLDPVGVDGGGVIESSWSLYGMISWGYVVGIIIFTCLLAVRLMRTFWLFRGQPFKIVQGVRIYRIPNCPSFSFLNSIQLSPELDENSAAIVLEHEKLHVRKKHSYELILFELLQVVFWFNPIFFWVRNRLVNVHEFDVDKRLYDKYKVSYMHFLLDYSLGLASSKFVLSNPFFNQLTLKKRIMMMNSKKKFGWGIWLVLPLIFSAGLLVQCTDDEVKPATDESATEELSSHEPNEQVYEDVEIMPEFPGGQEGLMNFIMEQVNYPKEAKEREEEGTVYVSYVVGKDGVVRDINLKKGVSELLDTEAKRVVSLMPTWTPGQVAGKDVSVELVLPIAFRLE